MMKTEVAQAITQCEVAIYEPWQSNILIISIINLSITSVAIIGLIYPSTIENNYQTCNKNLRYRYYT